MNNPPPAGDISSFSAPFSLSLANRYNRADMSASVHPDISADQKKRKEMCVEALLRLTIDRHKEKIDIRSKLAPERDMTLSLLLMNPLEGAR